MKALYYKTKTYLKFFVRLVEISPSKPTKPILGILKKGKIPPLTLKFEISEKFRYKHHPKFFLRGQVTQFGF